MKKLFLIVHFSLFILSCATAQNTDPIRPAASAATVLAVDIEVSSEQITAGPYARYAQKLLGIRPALSDKTIHTITGARIALLPSGEEYPTAGKLPEKTQRTIGYEARGADFARLPVDRSTVGEVIDPQAAAQKAAAALFTIRRQRMELIGGDAGEHVFGAGLPAALERLDRMEQEYLELFLGRRIATTETHRFRVVPVENEYSATVCHFSTDAGIVPVDDLSSTPVSLGFELRPVEQTGVKPSSKTTFYRVAAPTDCTLTHDDGVLASETLPIFQFGRTIALPK